MISTKRIIGFGDCDPAGVLFFPRVFEFAHTAMENWLREAGVYDEYFLNEEFAFPLISAQSSYYKPMHPGLEIEVRSSLKEMRESAFSLRTEFFNQEEQLLSAVDTIHICVSREEGGKQPIPAYLRSILENL